VGLVIIRNKDIRKRNLDWSNTSTVLDFNKLVTDALASNSDQPLEKK